METITTQAEIDSNGTLHLELPTGLTPGPAEVVVVVHSTVPRPGELAPSLSGKYSAYSPGDFDPVEEVREIRRRATEETQEIPE